MRGSYGFSISGVETHVETAPHSLMQCSVCSNYSTDVGVLAIRLSQIGQPGLSWPLSIRSAFTVEDNTFACASNSPTNFSLMTSF